jgi:hypothetical protein
MKAESFRDIVQRDVMQTKKLNGIMRRDVMQTKALVIQASMSRNQLK